MRARKCSLDFGPLYEARLQKGFKCGVSPYLGEVALCVLGSSAIYPYGICEKYLIKVSTLCKYILFPKNLWQKEIFQTLNTPFRKCFGGSTFQKGVILGVFKLSSQKNMIGRQILAVLKAD